MATLTGKYVARFADANMGMLDGVSLNAPYPFHWVYIIEIDGADLVCRAGREIKRLPITSDARSDRAEIAVPDPIFGDLPFTVLPFHAERADG